MKREGEEKNKEPLSRLFILTWLFDRLSYFHYPDCSCDNYRYRCYPSNWTSQWSSKYWGQPGNCFMLFEAYMHHLVPVQSLCFNFILIYKDFRWWEGEENGLILYLDNRKTGWSKRMTVMITEFVWIVNIRVIYN